MQSEIRETKANTVVRAPEGASQDIEDFIYLISHDVRASVRALIELPQWIAEDLEESGVQINGSVASSIDLMNRHTGRLDRMLVDLLAFSRVGRMQKTEEISLDMALDEVLEDMKIPAAFSVERNFEHSSLELGARDALTLLRALISNAIKHHDKERGRVLVSSRRSGDLVLLSVSDNGPGIEDEYHTHIFAPMTTLRPRDEVEGSGMGLAITRKIALHYGGGVEVSFSPFGRGTQMNVSLPLPSSH
jgi:signal transduction histidine kinase